MLYGATHGSVVAQKRQAAGAGYGSAIVQKGQAALRKEEFQGA